MVIGGCHYIKGEKMGKVIEKDKLDELLKILRAKNKVIVTTNGCFDILHVGHVRYLKKSKTFGDILIVCLNSDKSVHSIKGEGRPINNENDRAEILAELECVDFVVIFDEESPSKLIDELKPDIYTKGADYSLETLPERDVVLKNNIEVKFIKFVEGKSTTNIIKTIQK